LHFSVATAIGLESFPAPVPQRKLAQQLEQHEMQKSSKLHSEEADYIEAVRAQFVKARPHHAKNRKEESHLNNRTERDVRASFSPATSISSCPHIGNLPWDTPAAQASRRAVVADLGLGRFGNHLFTLGAAVAYAVKHNIALHVPIRVLDKYGFDLPCLRSTHGFENMTTKNLEAMAPVSLFGYQCGYCQNATLLLSSSTSFGSFINMRAVLRVAFYMPTCLSPSEESSLVGDSIKKSSTRRGRSKENQAAKFKSNEGYTIDGSGTLPELKNAPLSQSQTPATLYFRTFEYPLDVNSSKLPVKEEANIFNARMQRKKIFRTKRLNRPPILFFEEALRDAVWGASATNRYKHNNSNSRVNNNKTISGELSDEVVRLRSQNGHKLKSGTKRSNANGHFLSNATVLCDPSHVNHSTLQYLHVVVHLSDHNPVMVAQVDYYIRANYSINAKGKLRYLTKLFIL